MSNTVNGNLETMHFERFHKERPHATLNNGPKIKSEANHFSECSKTEKCQCCKGQLYSSKNEKVLWYTQKFK
jgi:hypothetical protein